MAAKKNKQKRTFVNEKLLTFIQTSVMIITYCVIIIFLMVNIASSQNIPQVFFDTANGKEQAIVQMFQKAAETSQFPMILPEVKGVLSMHSKEVYKDAYDRNTQITTLQKLLKSNPESPEILYSLYLLYEAEKDTKRADSYLQQARRIDPNIGL